MNIFMTDPSPQQSAKNLCYVHIVKMILESAQILSTAHRVIEGDERADSLGLYKKTHINHPSSVWARASVANYNWLYSHFIELGRLYEQRKGKPHKTIEKLSEALILAPKGLPENQTPPPACVSDEFKDLDESVFTKYQLYLDSKYRGWLNRDKPVKVEFLN